MAGGNQPGGLQSLVRAFMDLQTQKMNLLLSERGMELGKQVIHCASG